MISQLNIRQRTEEREAGFSRFAAKSALSRGRPDGEEICPIRTAFQRDRDRIIHSNSFRRLKHKTQVFIAPLGDHYVTRLTHTLEVSQLARTITRALNLNEDLAEAISLGHDLGHTPFGHVGEEVLNELYEPGFRHNEQSLRVVERLERGGRGLNLTWEVRDGILNHSKTRADIVSEGGGSTLESQVCRLADALAYINHDIGDAIRANIITEADLPEEATSVLGSGHSQRINSMVCDIIESSWMASGLVEEPSPSIGMNHHILEASNRLRDFLFEKVYLTRDKKAEEAREVVRRLYMHFVSHEDRLPPEYLAKGDETERRVVDYIAGMTDGYAKRLAESLN